MKKRILAGLLSLCMLVGLLPMTALATETELIRTTRISLVAHTSNALNWTQDGDVTTSYTWNKSNDDEGWKWQYDTATQKYTLTLNNANIEVSDNSAISFPTGLTNTYSSACDGIDIMLYGENRVISTHDSNNTYDGSGIVYQSDPGTTPAPITVIGKDGGSLEASGVRDGFYTYSLLTVQDATLKLSSGNGCALYGGKGLTLENSTVNVAKTAVGAGNPAIMCGTLTIEKSKVDVTATEGATGIHATNSIAISDNSEITIQGSGEAVGGAGLQYANSPGSATMSIANSKITIKNMASGISASNDINSVTMSGATLNIDVTGAALGFKTGKVSIADSEGTLVGNGGTNFNCAGAKYFKEVSNSTLWLENNNSSTSLAVYGDHILTSDTEKNYLTIGKDSSLTIPEGITLAVNSSATINGILVNNGTLENKSGVMISGDGNLAGTGVFAQNAIYDKGIRIPRNIAAPEAKSVTTDTVELNPVTPDKGEGYGKVEYGYSQAEGTRPSTWQEGTVFEGLTPGTDYYFYARVGDVNWNSAYADVTSTTGTKISTVPPTYTISVDPEALDFGSLRTGYTAAPEAATVTITNTGNQSITLTQPTATNYEIGTLSKTDLAAGEKATFTVQPKGSLAAGTYSETIEVQGAKGVNNTNAVHITATFTVKASNSGGGGGGTPTYTPDVPQSDNGTVTVTPKNPRTGDQVTVTPKPDEGYEVDKITVTDKDGKPVEVTEKEDGTFTFTQPSGKVKIEVTYKPVGDEWENPFTDVAEQDYYYDAVRWAVDKKITTGTTDTTFSPNASCTRGQMVTFLWRAAGSPAVTGENPFTDVKTDAYYYDAVLWAVQKGITTGVTATTFAPDATVTRGQTVTFLYRNAGTPAATGNAFTDVAADAYYAKAVAWAVAEKITNGTSDTTFSPEADCTRGQIVTFLYRDAT